MAEPVSEPVSSLLHFYRLRASQTRRLPARSDLHKNAHIRMHPDDVDPLAGPDARTMVALFSTGDVSEPVSLRSGETIFVMPGKRAKRAKQAAQNTATHADTENTGNTENTENTEWIPLRLAASHAYVSGMRVSGVIHRAVLRLERW